MLSKTAENVLFQEDVHPQSWGKGREAVNYPEHWHVCSQDSFILEFYGIWDFYCLNKDFFFMMVVLNQNASPC